MRTIKRSLNIDENLNKKIDLIIKDNPEINFTVIATQALKAWINNPELTLAKPRAVTQKDIENMMDEDRELLEDLAK
jgi:hypothetical protein